MIHNEVSTNHQLTENSLWFNLDELDEESLSGGAVEGELAWSIGFSDAFRAPSNSST
ncbi:hypothetical protein [[Phormidium ambiguum] IAM M-71]|uniref:hypothetical protein n=1 Tax=[Phormidium ambiguum] IAM M-71 TaxID=454136 RepID=UPI0015B9B3C7|nr:hypothetical protein [Phormidium ambiguum]